MQPHSQPYRREVLSHLAAFELLLRSYWVFSLVLAYLLWLVFYDPASADHFITIIEYGRLARSYRPLGLIKDNSRI